jgi:hypothetical protein
MITVQVCWPKLAQSGTNKINFVTLIKMSKRPKGQKAKWIKRSKGQMA